METLKKLLGDNLMKDDTNEVSTEDALENKTVICLYFSAHWCPPCRSFTPLLKEKYEKKTEDEVEIVFVSSDRQEAEFKSYFSEMPWLAVKWENLGGLKAKLASDYEVSGIPKLVAIKRDGSVIDMNGRAFVSQKGHFNFSSK